MPRKSAGRREIARQAERQKKRKTKTCGELGGTNIETGTPCTRSAGWGTPHKGQGRCYDHDEAAEARKQGQKLEFLATFASGTTSLTEACAKIGVGPPQIWRWRQDDPDFDAGYIRARDTSDKGRAALAEDALFARIMKGKAAPAETTFFLTNRDPERWKSRQYRTHEGAMTVEQILQEAEEDDEEEEG